MAKANLGSETMKTINDCIAQLTAQYPQYTGTWESLNALRGENEYITAANMAAAIFANTPGIEPSMLFDTVELYCDIIKNSEVTCYKYLLNGVIYDELEDAQKSPDWYFHNFSTVLAPNETE